MSPSPRSARAELSDPTLRLYLARYLRRRLPAADADDALQAVYCAALEARSVPDDLEELRRWMTVVARRKVASYYERSASEQLGDPPEQAVEPAPIEAISLLRWAERQAANSQVEHVDETLDWMARESDGEKLEAIAAEADIPSTRVRQRVVRLRRFMRARWALELSAALLLAAMVWWLWPRPAQRIVIPSPMPSLSIAVPVPHDDWKERAVELRKRALRSCELGLHRECLRALDEAAALDPAGDSDPFIGEARRHALEKLAPPAPKSTVTKPTKAKPSGTPTAGKTF
jgi:DNA-directed RNA polymerase specialized sigma24 family protein